MKSIWLWLGAFVITLLASQDPYILIPIQVFIFALGGELVIILMVIALLFLKWVTGGIE